MHQKRSSTSTCRGFCPAGGRPLLVITQIVTPAAFVPAAQAETEDAHSHAERRAHCHVDERLPERVEHTYPHDRKVQYWQLKNKSKISQVINSVKVIMYSKKLRNLFLIV
jgi:hypothetical protein